MNLATKSKISRNNINVEILPIKEIEMFKDYTRILGVCFILLCSNTWANKQELIKNVENSLSPVNSFKGDELWDLQERMKHYGVPSVGIAVIKDYKVSWFKTYGLADREAGKIASNQTLFQAGSVSKPLAAFGALRLVEVVNSRLMKISIQRLKVGNFQRTNLPLKPKLPYDNY